MFDVQRPVLPFKAREAVLSILEWMGRHRAKSFKLELEVLNKRLLLIDINITKG